MRADEVFCNPSFLLVMLVGIYYILLVCFGSSFVRPFLFIYTILILPVKKKV